MTKNKPYEYFKLYDNTFCENDFIFSYIPGHAPYSYTLRITPENLEKLPFEVKKEIISSLLEKKSDLHINMIDPEITDNKINSLFSLLGVSNGMYIFQLSWKTFLALAKLGVKEIQYVVVEATRNSVWGRKCSSKCLKEYAKLDFVNSRKYVCYGYLHGTHGFEQNYLQILRLAIKGWKEARETFISLININMPILKFFCLLGWEEAKDEAVRLLSIENIDAKEYFTLFEFAEDGHKEAQNYICEGYAWGQYGMIEDLGSLSYYARIFKNWSGIQLYILKILNSYISYNEKESFINNLSFLHFSEKYKLLSSYTHISSHFKVDEYLEVPWKYGNSYLQEAYALGRYGFPKNNKKSKMYSNKGK